MIERNIKFKEIQNTIDLPDYTISHNKNKEAFKKIDDKTLRVVFFNKDNFIKIITLMGK